MLVKSTPIVNFINVICAHFSYKFFAKAKTELEKAAEMTSVRKMLMKLTPTLPLPLCLRKDD